MTLGTQAYKSIQILDPAPTGAGGLLIQNNMIALADSVGMTHTHDTDPTVDCDAAHGYTKWDWWLNTADNSIWLAVDVTTEGAAVWRQLNQQGPQGFQGSQGRTGSRGEQGFQGAYGGPQGATGSQGPRGFQGAVGSPGIGFQGVQGAVGEKGEQGVQGRPGDYGGPQGSQGVQGDIGYSPVLRMGMGMGEVADAIYVTQYGTQGEYIQLTDSLTGSQGPQGIPGSDSTEPGPQGADGNTPALQMGTGVQADRIYVSYDSGASYMPLSGHLIGPQGVQGATGSPGVSDIPGPQGMTGPQGNDGMPGGPQGSPGSDGAQGAPGSNGSDGHSPTVTSDGIYLVVDGNQSGSPIRGSDGSQGAAGQDGHSPTVTTDGVYLVVDGSQSGSPINVGNQGADGHSPTVTTDGTYLLVDGNQSGSPIRGSDGSQGAAGVAIHWAGDWSHPTSYSVGDVVRYYGDIYACNTAHTSTYSAGANGDEWGESQDWDIMLPHASALGLNFRGGWDVATAYALNDVVLYTTSGCTGSWVCLNGNTGSYPDVSPTDWALVAQGGVNGAPGNDGAQGAPGEGIPTTGNCNTGYYSLFVVNGIANSWSPLWLPSMPSDGTYNLTITNGTPTWTSV